MLGQLNHNLHLKVCGSLLIIISALFLFSCTKTDKFILITPVFTNITHEANLVDTTITFSAAAADWNQDSYPDLIVSTHGNVIYFQNDKQGKFEDPYYVGGEDIRDTHGVSFIDLNEDGIVDLGVSKGAERGLGKGSNEFYLNDNSVFTHLDSLDAMLLDPLGRGRAIIPYDLNLDGKGDLMIMNFLQKNRPHRFAISNAKNASSFSDVYPNSGTEPLRTTSFLPLNINNNDEEFFFAQGNGYDAGKVFKKVPTDNGNIKFVDAGKELGLENDVFTRKIIPIDYDADGDLDLFYIRSFKEFTGSFVEGNRIYFKYDGSRYNRLKVGFSVIAEGNKFTLNTTFNEWPNPKWLYLGANRKKVDNIPFSMNLDDPGLQGSPVIDRENDTGMFLWTNNDKFILEVIGAQGKLEGFTGYLEFEKEIDPMTVMDIGLDTASRVRRNRLLKNEQGKFVEVTDSAGVGGFGRAYDVVPADFNNDSYMDLYVVNGGDYFDNVPNQLFLNQGDGTFVETADTSGVKGTELGKGNGTIAFDYDLDGDIDIFLYNGAGSWPNNEGPIELLRNDLPPSQNFIVLTLKGTDSNTRAWGARVLTTLGERKILQQKYPANGCLSTSDLPIHIGLGTRQKADKITIYWPSGKVTDLKDVVGGSILEISESME